MSANCCSVNCRAASRCWSCTRAYPGSSRAGSFSAARGNASCWRRMWPRPRLPCRASARSSIRAWCASAATARATACSGCPSSPCRVPAPISARAAAAVWGRACACGSIREADFEARAPFTEPEILRTNLAALLLRLAADGLGEAEDFPFIDPPDARARGDGYRLLQELQALDADRRITRRGRIMARLPLDPRLARALLESKRFSRRQPNCSPSSRASAFRTFEWRRGGERRRPAQPRMPPAAAVRGRQVRVLLAGQGLEGVSRSARGPAARTQALVQGAPLLIAAPLRMGRCLRPGRRSRGGARSGGAAASGQLRRRASLAARGFLHHGGHARRGGRLSRHARECTFIFSRVRRWRGAGRGGSWRRTSSRPRGYSRAALRKSNRSGSRLPPRT